MANVLYVRVTMIFCKIVRIRTCMFKEYAKCCNFMSSKTSEHKTGVNYENKDFKSFVILFYTLFFFVIVFCVNISKIYLEYMIFLTCLEPFLIDKLIPTLSLKSSLHEPQLPVEWSVPFLHSLVVERRC